MRFKMKPQPEEGDTRIKSKFLLFPKTINNGTRWLERAKWTEELKRRPARLPNGLIARNIYERRWVVIEWEDIAVAGNQCSCKSYNLGIGTIPNKILTLPSGETKCIDACIANVIQKLWDNGIETIGSCCGHGSKKPSVVLQQNCSKSHANRVKKLIKSIDERDFDLLSWTLTAL